MMEHKNDDNFDIDVFHKIDGNTYIDDDSDLDNNDHKGTSVDEITILRIIRIMLTIQEDL